MLDGEDLSNLKKAFYGFEEKDTIRLKEVSHLKNTFIYKGREVRYEIPVGSGEKTISLKELMDNYTHVGLFLIVDHEITTPSGMADIVNYRLFKCKKSEKEFAAVSKPDVIENLVSLQTQSLN